MTIAALFVYFLTLLGLGVFSYGFNDPNLALSSNGLILRLQAPLIAFVYHQRPAATMVFFVILVLLFICYGIFLKSQHYIFRSWKKLVIILGISAALLSLSYPGLTYDLFNYITTAKVAYHYGENPYLVMPVEIPNEPYLAFTRAANKLALYGPAWILLSWIPYVLGNGDIWRTIIAFKLMNAVAYLGFSYLVYRTTRNLTNVLFFALNPLVLLEVIMNGHNDIYMMMLALGGLLLWQKKGMRMMLGGMILFASWWVKGATVVLAPLLLFPKLTDERMFTYAYWLLLTVFFFIAPLREELYPWYAVWLVMTASLLPFNRHRYLIGSAIVLTFALELRHLPYMWMGYYEGPGPLLRFGLTAIPLVLYLGYLGFIAFRKRRM